MNNLVPLSLLLGFLLIVLIPVDQCLDIYEPKSLEARIVERDYGYVQCYSSGHIEDRRVLRPDFSKMDGKRGTLGDFEVNYTGFTTEARMAFQYAVDIWDMLLDSEAKIVVNARFADLNSGVLGSAAPTAMYVDFSDKVDEGIEYAAPLADKIAGYSLNGSAADLTCNFSNSANWYFDYNQPDLIADNQTDFVSVVLHELGHGLGFLSRNTLESDGIGFIDATAPAMTDIFSLLLEEGNSNNLFLNYDEGSEELGRALTSNDLYLHPHTFSTEDRPVIYAPSTWNGGSSLSHLDEWTYSDSNLLMTPFLGANSVIHDPEIALVMMQDMGWSSSFIAHRSAHVEIVNQPIPIECKITSDQGVGFDTASVILVYSQDSFRLNQDTVTMESNDQLTFYADLPTGNHTGRYQYYIALADTINLGYSSPLIAPQRFHDIHVGIDTVPPVIDHTAIEYFFFNEKLLEFSALVDDSFTGVNSVMIEYMVNGGAMTTARMTLDEGDKYDQVLDIDVSALREGDIIEYRLKATDNATMANVSYIPSQGFHRIAVKDKPQPVAHYSTGFADANIDFVFNEFSLRMDEGFDGVGLHSEHPYINAGSGNELHFTAQLRIPIRVVQGGTIEFDEVVLVEPGGSNSVFGGSDFWDYVIVEASKDNGANWTPLVDGYDSSSFTSWKSRYDSGISGQNSSSTGDKDLIQRRIIQLHQSSQGIDIGDVVLLRWRLYSDAFAFGWGWMIDNLEVQKEQTTNAITHLNDPKDPVNIFPNPIVDNKLTYTMDGAEQIHLVWISDINGIILLQMHTNISQDNGQIDVSDLPAGIYFATFHCEDLAITKRFIKP